MVSRLESSGPEDDASDAAVSLTTSTGASSVGLALFATGRRREPTRGFCASVVLFFLVLSQAVPLSSFQEQKQRKVDLQIGINKSGP